MQLAASALGTTGAIGVGTVITAGAITGAAASVAGQAVMIAGGAQNGLDWKGVAVGAIAGGIAAGVGGVPGGSTGAAQGTSSASQFGLAVARGAGTMAASEAVGSVLGVQSFSWRDVAASAVASGVSYGVGMRTQGWSTTAQRITNGLATGAASAAVHGNLSKSWQGIAQDVAGNTIGNTIADHLESLTPITTGRIDISDDIRLTPDDTRIVVDTGNPSVGAAMGVVQGPQAGSSATQRGFAGSVTGSPVLSAANPADAVTLEAIEVRPDRYSEADNAMWNAGLDASTQFRADQADLVAVSARREALAAHESVQNAQIQRMLQSDAKEFVLLQASLAAGGGFGALAAVSPMAALALNSVGTAHGVNSIADGYYSGSKLQFGVGVVETGLSMFGLGAVTKALGSTETLTAAAWNPEWVSATPLTRPLAEPDVVPNTTADSFLTNPQNIANAPRLSQQLTSESATSSFNTDGTLTQQAINDSRLIIGPEDLSNPAIPAGYGKYSTQTFQSTYGNFQTHFYMNAGTGDVYYGLDYKSVFNIMSGVRNP
jgi:hypothetical protein